MNNDLYEKIFKIVFLLWIGFFLGQNSQLVKHLENIELGLSDLKDEQILLLDNNNKIFCETNDYKGKTCQDIKKLEENPVKVRIPSFVKTSKTKR